jgi:hypothetical protein
LILGFGEIGTNGTVVYVFFGGKDGIGGNGGSGGTGGIFIASTESANAIVQNSIIALNTGASGGVGGLTQNTNGSFVPGIVVASGATDVAGQFVSKGHNLIGQTAGSSGFTNSSNGDLAGSATTPLNPMLRPLADNGRNTPTFALLPGSPAIDAGDDRLLGPPENLTEDQRGQARKSGAHVDIGAFEYNGLYDGMVLPPSLTDSATSANGLQFWFNGASGHNFSIWASTDLAVWNWIGLASEVSKGWFVYQDFAATNFNHRFYQVRFP